MTSTPTSCICTTSTATGSTVRHSRHGYARAPDACAPYGHSTTPGPTPGTAHGTALPDADVGPTRRVPRKVPHAAQLSGIMVPGECRRRLRTKAPRSVRTARSGNCSRQPMARLRSRRIGARRISPHCHTQPRRHRMLQPRSRHPPQALRPYWPQPRSGLRPKGCTTSLSCDIVCLPAIA